MNSNELAKTRTKLANQRTYLAYVRTGFSIASIAGVFKKKYIALFGLLMIIISSIQYIIILKHINNNKLINQIIHFIPISYLVISTLVLYLQFYK